MSELPSLNPALIFKTWITTKEEAAMGVEPMKTELHHATHFNDLNSDGLNTIYQDYSRATAKVSHVICFLSDFSL